MRKAFLVLPALLAISIGVATATAGGGNSANAKLCQKDGWINQQGSDGTQFTSEEQCVAFGAHGGTLAPAPATVSISFTTTSNPDFCGVTANLSHFAPNTQYQVFASAGGMTFGPSPVTTDSVGAGSVGLFSLHVGAGVSASVGSVSGSATVSC